MTRRRVDLREAAEILDTSVDAVRKRIQRGTLESEKADGKVYVWLDDGAPRSDTDTLISEMRAHNATLREQLEAERQAHAEARRIIAGLVERIPPAIEPPRGPRREATGGPESAETVSEGAEPRSAAGGPQEAREAPFPHGRSQEHPEEGLERPWWRRMFGG